MQALRTAVIGVGYLGRFHAQKYAQVPGSELVAVGDARGHARDAVARELGCRAVADHRELLDHRAPLGDYTPVDSGRALDNRLADASQAPTLAQRVGVSEPGLAADVAPTSPSFSQEST